MRQPQREIKDPEIMDSIFRQAYVCRLAMIADGRPYIVPMNFGYYDRRLYFHSAPDGTKIQALRINPQVCFEVEGTAEIQSHPTQACRWSTKYQSIIGHGLAYMVDDAESKRQALTIIMRHYTDNPVLLHFDEVSLSQMAIIRVDIQSMTGKQSKHYLAP